MFDPTSLRLRQEFAMNIATALQRTFEFVWEGVLRLFSPSDDIYPAVGVQPFDGDPYTATQARHQQS